jgi:hypothetical protein
MRFELISASATAPYPIVTLKDTSTKKEYVVLSVKNGPTTGPLLMDIESYDPNGPHLSIGNNGYARMGTQAHHQYINGDTPNGLSVDHINWQKTDNRKANLRSATQSQQNENRGQRCDKLDPFIELIELGIYRLPRLLRWDGSEEKFVVENEKQITGTKSVKVSTVNKFRNCLLRLTAFLETNVNPVKDNFVLQRTKLADEYNQLIYAAHIAIPTIFKNGPYIDLEDMCGALDYCNICMDKLPAVKPGEILHGVLNIPTQYMPIPDLDSFALIKQYNGNDTRIVLFDNKYADIASLLPAMDVFGSAPYLTSTTQLHELFPAFVSKADVNAKKKFMVKDLIWCAVLKREKPADHTVVPFNYRQYDLRVTNLRLLPGEPKNHKSPEGPQDILEEYGLKCRFWPKTLSFSPTYAKTGKSPMAFLIRQASGRKLFTCSETTLIDTFENKVLPYLRSNDDKFEENNDLFQKLHGEYEDLVNDILYELSQ